VVGFRSKIVSGGRLVQKVFGFVGESRYIIFQGVTDQAGFLATAED